MPQFQIPSIQCYAWVLIGIATAAGCQPNDVSTGTQSAASQSAASQSANSSGTATEPKWSSVIRLGRSGKLDRIEVHRTVIGDDDVAKLSSADGWLETLILDAGVLTDDSIDAIASLPGLVHLRLRESPITDNGLNRLARCQTLQILNLPQSRVTAEGIQSLTQLPNLRNLRLGGETLADPHQSDSVVDAIASIKSLRSLHLIGVPISDEGLQRIASLPKLQSLYLDDSAISEEGWNWLFQHHADIHVHVNQQHLDRDPKQHDH